MNVTTRKEARLQGLTQYFTGKPCRRDHITTRYVSNATCEKCMKEDTSKHYQENSDLYKNRAVLWAKNNPVKRRKVERNRYKNNRGHYLNWFAARRAKVNTLISEQEKCYIAALYKQARERDMHVDHIVPLSRGGVHRAFNLQLLTPCENMKKGNNISMEYYL